jgi:hypothetical protein
VVLKVATPALNVSVPSVAPPSLKVTVPVASLGPTDVVKVMLAPRAGVAVEVVRVVVVPAVETNTGTPLLALVS